MVDPFDIIDGFKLELIFTFSETVFEQLVEGFVSVTVATPIPAVPQFTETEFVFCPEAIVPPLIDHEKVFPEFKTE